ncbi:hypothetical protein KFE98_17175 [bacterium SCSIO 12741]|nr:hypothetical protein KFE98_17175 [bacterium SCSIO 12741]
MLEQLENEANSRSIQKVLSFTDNRQDAALQSGHFNDYMQQIFIRSCLNQALIAAEQEDGYLDHATIASRVFETMELKEEDFAKDPNKHHKYIQKNEECFETWLEYQLFEDLCWSQSYWMPGLEQCALLRIHYNCLDEVCKEEERWSTSRLLSQMNEVQRLNFLTQVLNYFRHSGAIEYYTLSAEQIRRNEKDFKARLRKDSLYNPKVKINDPSYLRIKPAKTKKAYTKSVGYRSLFGSYVKEKLVDFIGKPLVKEELDQEIESILESLEKAGYLRVFRFSDVPLYRLSVENIQWFKGDGKTVVPDEIRIRSKRRQNTEPNTYYQAEYQRNPKGYKQKVSREHSGQIKADERKDVEDQFREASVKALFCSPTMELGIDIHDLCVVHMRNVPPNPSNYAQRSGRAGRNGQGALILTYCSNNSAHDRHYFEHREDMVSGTVIPQKLDLINPELLKSHIQSVYLARCNLKELRSSLAEVMDLNDHSLPLYENIQEGLKLDDQTIRELEVYFKRVFSGIEHQLEQTSWYTPSWIWDQLKNTPTSFNQAFNRWRELYEEARHSKELASTRMQQTRLTKSHQEWKDADYEVHRDQRKMDLLINKGGGHQDYSEFYPYRYLAAEGFLPGYDFTRLPYRVFLYGGESEGEYIQRPRLLALREFGPENFVYQKGQKWKIRQIHVPSKKENKLIETALINKNLGYFHPDRDLKKDVSQFSGKTLLSTDFEEYGNLLNMQDMTARQQQRISCQENERMRKGYQIETYFSYHKSQEYSQKLNIHDGTDHLITVHLLPAAELIQVNCGWRKNKGGNGFLLQTKSGHWKSVNQLKDEDPKVLELIKEVKLYTQITADCLYLEPVRQLNLDRNGVITLMYALKLALERHFQVESRELACTLMGDAEMPNILFYEATEGSLGILSQLLASPETFKTITEEAYGICHFREGKDVHPEGNKHQASYDDLLSYYNQRHHSQIDRFSIKNILELFQKANYQSLTENGHSPYESHYLKLKKQLVEMDPDLENLVDELHTQRRKLPQHLHFRPGNCSQSFACYFSNQVGIQLHNPVSLKWEDDPLDQSLQSPENLGIEALTLKPNDSPQDFIRKHLHCFPLQTN